MNIYDHYETVLPLFLSSQTFSHILRDKPVVHAKKNSQKKNFAHFSFYKDKKKRKKKHDKRERTDIERKWLEYLFKLILAVGVTGIER